MTLEMRDVPTFTHWNLVPEVLNPGSEGKIIVSYDAAKSENWGLGLNMFRLVTNDTLEPEKPITVGYNIIEDFSYLKAEKDPKLPVATFNTTNHDFGKIRTGSIPSYSFIVKNTGSSDLIIRKVRPSCGCTVTTLAKSILKPGEETKIETQFNSTGYTGVQSKSIMVICNDPTNSMTILNFSADVVQ